mgnify:CR=1 FL=1
MLVAIGFLIAFLISVKNGQYTDTYTPSIRMLFDDPEKNQEKDLNKDKKTHS